MDDGEPYQNTIRWVCADQVLQLHQEVIALTPEETPGVRDFGLLESACERPNIHRYYTQNEDIFLLAAVFGEALCNYHPFYNANKRTAAKTVYVFLSVNGQELTAPGEEIVIAYEQLATGEIDIEMFSLWLATWCREFDASELNY